MRKVSLGRATQIAIDLIVLSMAMALAFLLRFEGAVPIEMLGRLVLTAPYVIVFQYLVLVMYGVPRFAWRYVGLREAMTIFLALATSAFGLTIGRLVANALRSDYPFFHRGIIPFGVIGIDTALAFLGIVGVRILRRMIAEESESKARREKVDVPAIRTLLVGAGQAGVLVAREIERSPELGIAPVGFVDDDLAKVGTLIHGIAVLGTTNDLVRLCEEHDAQQILVTMASAPGSAMRRIKALGEQAALPTKVIPGVAEIVGGRVNLSRIRQIEIADLLGRDPVHLDVEEIRGIVEGRAVLVTGAGGSIGSELCRQLCAFAPGNLVLVERAETSLFHIHRELLATHPSVHITPCIADVGDAARMRDIFTAHRPAIVFHAAAHKHVPMMEWNPGEAIKNNVLGTKNVADLAHEFATEAFVLISTDKAVNPSSVMGASKRCAEIYVQSLAQRSSTRFAAVRFGNVLGSAGSVIPIFQEQIAAGGPVTVTHPEMRRYFMTIPEACQLVIQTGSMGRGGEIFILDMGEPVRIVDLARDLISLSGLRVQDDIEIRFTGMRPGEKLFEELATDAEQADKTRHEKIFVARIRPYDWQDVERYCSMLSEAAETQRPAFILATLREVVPEFRPPDSTTEAVRPSRPSEPQRSAPPN